MAIRAGIQSRPQLTGAAIRRPVSRAMAGRQGLLTKTPLWVRWLCLLFIFTFPFEAVTAGVVSGGATGTRILGLLFAGLYFFYHNPLSQRQLPHVPSSMWWFLLHLVIYSLHGVFAPEDSLGSVVKRLITPIQLIVMFWILSDLLSNGRLRRQALLAYGIGGTLVAIGVVLGLPGFSTTVSAGMERETVGNLDPNFFAIYLSLALVFLLGLFLSGEFKSIIVKSILIVSILPIVLLIVRTGSRTGMAVAVIGCSTYAMPGLIARVSKWKKSTAFMVGLFGIITIGFMVASNPDALERWKQVYYEQKLSGREKIIPAAIEMIQERPVLGWGPGEASRELGLRLGETGGKGGHNLVLDLLMQGGLVAAIPALFGLWLCFKNAWIARHGAMGLVPLAGFLTIMAGNMAVPFLYRKPVWLALALAVAGARVALAGKRRRNRNTLQGQLYRKEGFRTR